MVFMRGGRFSQMGLAIDTLVLSFNYSAHDSLIHLILLCNMHSMLLSASPKWV
jgi:hypothetical protein